MDSIESSKDCGVNAHLDYLTIIFDVSTPDFQHFLDLFSVYTGIIINDSPWSAGKGCPYYPNKIHGARGLAGGFQEENSITKGMLQFPGNFWEQFTILESIDFLQMLTAFNIRISRIDLAIDCPLDTIPVSQMFAAWMRGDNYHFRSYKYYLSADSPDTIEDTHYYGSRDSGKLTRIYNHEFQDKSRLQRHEVEYKRSYASKAFYALISAGSEEDFKNTILSLNTGAIDFRNKSSQSSNSNTSVRNTKRLDFWQEYIDFLQAAPFRLKPNIQPDFTPIRSIRWLKRQVSGTLAAINAAFKSTDLFVDFILTLVAIGNFKESANYRLITRSLSMIPDIWDTEIFSVNYS
jgi:hypothetical protein